MITVDLASSVPLEDQVRQGIRQAIARGEVRPGDTLPSVRQLAGDLDIHWNTVARAYRRLRDEGLLTVGRGRGVTVRTPPRPVSVEPGEAPARVRKQLGAVIADAKLAGLDYSDVKKLIEGELRSWRNAWLEGS